MSPHLFNPGDRVKVHQLISELEKGEEKSRVQIFEGVVIKTRGRGENKSFIVRKLVGNIAVERIWPLNSPSIKKVEIKSKPKSRIRRAKLYHLRRSS